MYGPPNNATPKHQGTTTLLHSLDGVSKTITLTRLLPKMFPTILWLKAEASLICEHFVPILRSPFSVLSGSTVLRRMVSSCSIWTSPWTSRVMFCSLLRYSVSRNTTSCGCTKIIIQYGGVLLKVPQKLNPQLVVISCGGLWVAMARQIIDISCTSTSRNIALVQYETSGNLP